MTPVRLFFRTLRKANITYSKLDLASVALIAVVVAIWASVAGGAFSVLLLLACEVSFFSFYVAGSTIAAWRPLAEGVLFELPLRLLIGYGVVNTLLLILAWLSPFGIVVNFCAVLALVMVAFLVPRERRSVRSGAVSLWAIGMCLVATTLWCQDSLDPILEQGDVTTFKPWVDGFYHAVHIRIFADSHGASTIEDFRMAGVPARLYHYGVYMLPALVKQLSGIHSYAAFAGILAPVGVFLTGLAAYAFFGTLWGAWPGLTAAAALLLLPDGAQQGMQNPFMSYHWLTQISPSATYGLALLAVAWLFVIQGCRNASRLQLVTGWLVAAVIVVYKLHYVIASAFLLLLVPALFFRARLGPKKRALWVVSALIFYVVALAVGQRVPGVPLIRFDGSSTGEILYLIQSFAMPGKLTEYLAGRMGRDFAWTSNLLFGIPYVLFAVLGAVVPLLVVLVLRLRKRTTPLELAFPLLLIANFLLMFFGLALDLDSSTPDELSHRPLMIVYFFVVSWIGGALGLLVVDSRMSARIVRPAILALTAVLTVVPAFFGPGVQVMWTMPKISPVRIPTSAIRVAEYIRSHGSAEDVFQDSQFDRIYALAALSERRTFVAHTLTLMPFRGDMVATRSTAINRLMRLEQSKLVLGTARAYGLRWFVLHKGNSVKWPPEIADKPAFEDGSLTVYDLK